MRPLAWRSGASEDTSAPVATLARGDVPGERLQRLKLIESVGATRAPDRRGQAHRHQRVGGDGWVCEHREGLVLATALNTQHSATESVALEANGVTDSWRPGNT